VEGRGPPGEDLQQQPADGFGYPGFLDAVQRHHHELDLAGSILRKVCLEPNALLLEAADGHVFPSVHSIFNLLTRRIVFVRVDEFEEEIKEVEVDSASGPLKTEEEKVVEAEESNEKVSIPIP
jgi:hypothetical protein